MSAPSVFDQVPAPSVSEVLGKTRSATSAILLSSGIVTIALGASLTGLPALGGAMWLARTISVASGVTLSSKWLLERLAESIPTDHPLHRYAKSQKLQWCVSLLVGSLVGAAMPYMEFGIGEAISGDVPSQPAPAPAPAPLVEPAHLAPSPSVGDVSVLSPSPAIISTASTSVVPSVPLLPLAAFAGFSALAGASSIELVREAYRIRSETESANALAAPSRVPVSSRWGKPKDEQDRKDFDPLRVRTERDAVFVDKHGWTPSDSDWSEAGWWHSYALPTPNGEYVAILEDSPSDGRHQVRLIRYDGRLRAFDRTMSIPEGEPFGAGKIFALVEELFDRALQERDSEAIGKFRQIREIRVRSEDLPRIYSHVTDPETLRRGVETVFYWFQDLYSIRDGVLPYAGIRFPAKSEMRQSVASNSVSPAFLRNGLFESLAKTYAPYEMSRIAHGMSNMAGYPSKVGLPSAALFLNGHTHPGNLHAPSMMDLNDPDALAGIFERYPTIDSYVYCIISEWLPAQGEANAIPLRWNEYGWNRSYAMRFWKIERKPNGRYVPEDIVPLDAALS